MVQETADSELGSDEIRFTHDELLRALLDAQAEDVDDNGVMTRPELAEALGMTEYSTLKRIKVLLKDGTLEVAKKRIVNVLGLSTTTYGYKIADK